jgi:cyclopropane fatty-acyl-phospholipid synthase-like methyltransferase
MILKEIPEGTASLLDVGCGRGFIGALCRVYRDPSTLVGIDVFSPYLESCKKNGLYDEVLRVDLSKSALPFRNRAFEVATGIEVLEHLTREIGLRMLDEIERVATHVVLTTPGQFFVQQSYDANPSQRHLSHWSPRELEARGFTARGVGSLSLLRRWPALATALGPLTFPFPQLSSMFLCVRDGRQKYP